MSDLVDLLPIILIALLLWLLGLSIVFYRLYVHYRKIAKKSHDGSLVSAIDKLIKLEEENSKAVVEIKKELIRLDEAAALPIQKMGMARFNPFDETGGDQSFCVCLLNRENDGFVLTALHTRDRTRVYTKPVKSGKSIYDLSREEEKVLKEALKS